MGKNRYNINVGLSEYEIKAYISLARNHPVNGSQLSRHSGIPRARIYDVLRGLKGKGWVIEIGKGTYIPLPPDEMVKGLRRNFEADLIVLRRMIEAAKQPAENNFIWTIKGHSAAIEKAKEMIASATFEIYIRLFRQEGQYLYSDLKEAENRGVQVKYIALSNVPPDFGLMVVHPDSDTLCSELGGRTIDIVVDKKEILSGIFENETEDKDTWVNWGKNRWFVTSGRDSLRHDFFHYFLHKAYDRKIPLTDEEKSLYDLIKGDK